MSEINVGIVCTGSLDLRQSGSVYQRDTQKHWGENDAVKPFLVQSMRAKPYTLPALFRTS